MSFASLAGGPGRDWLDRQEKVNSLSILGSLIRDRTAQDLAEYGIALAIIALGAAAAAVVIAGDVATMWTTAQGLISSAV